MSDNTGEHSSSVIERITHCKWWGNDDWLGKVESFENVRYSKMTRSFCEYYGAYAVWSFENVHYNIMRQAYAAKCFESMHYSKMKQELNAVIEK